MTLEIGTLSIPGRFTQSYMVKNHSLIQDQKLKNCTKCYEKPLNTHNLRKYHEIVEAIRLSMSPSKNLLYQVGFV